MKGRVNKERKVVGELKKKKKRSTWLADGRKGHGR